MTGMLRGDVELRCFELDDLDWLVDQHARHYAESDGFDVTFGPLVLEIASGFLTAHDPTCEKGWIAVQDHMRLGSIFCVRQDETTAKLRLFFLVPEARGLGLGRRLLETCMRFAKDAGFAEMVLWTHESHAAACALYARAGWTIEQAVPVHSFGRDLVEQTWRYRF